MGEQVAGTRNQGAHRRQPQAALYDGDYAWTLTYAEPHFEIVGRPDVGLLVVYGAHRTIDGAIKRANAHMDML